MRFPPGTTLPPAPIVAQLRARNPDGRTDEAATSDCGESCLSSILEVATSFEIPPGCAREMLGLSGSDGRTTAEMLCRLLVGFGIGAYQRLDGADERWEYLARLRHYGRYQILLGSWIAAGRLHWVVAYERTSTAVSVMCPWNGVRVQYSRDVFRSRYEGEAVIAAFW